MTRQTFLALIGMIFFLAFGTTRLSAADEPDIIGQYSCVGGNITGGQYKGDVLITKEGDAFNLKWTIAGQSHFGIGILQGDKLSVSWISEGVGGIVVYKVEKGKLAGKWTQFGTKGKVLDETLTKKQ